MTTMSPAEIAAASPAAPASPAGKGTALYAWLYPALGFLSLVLASILWSLKKPLAGDELFTRIEIGDSSFAHLLHAAPRLGGGGMPLFYLTAWPWAHLFGLSNLSLRLYSTACIGLAFVVLTAILRRRVTAPAAFLGSAFAFFLSLIVMDQSVEARGYGLYLLLAVLAIGQWLRVAESEKPRPRDLLFLALTQAGLVLGHVLALLYAGLLLAALLLADRLQRRFRPRVYLCFLAGWLTLIPWIPAIRASMALGRPHTWIPVPTIADLAIGLSSSLLAGLYFPLFRNLPAALIAGWLCAMLLVFSLILGAAAAFRSASPARRALLLLAFALLFAPVLFFAVSRIAAPIYVARYMIPSALGIALLAAASLNGRTLSPRQAATGAIVLLLLPPLTAFVAHPDSFNTARVASLAAGRPLVCDWLQDFLSMQVLSMNDPGVSSVRAHYPLDWPAALQGPSSATGAYLLMQNYRREGYLADNILDASTVLAQPSFLVLDDTQTNWFHLTIENNPRFTWKLLAPIDHDRRLLEVTQNNP